MFFFSEDLVLFGRVTGRGGDTQRDSIHWLTPQMTAASGAGPSSAALQGDQQGARSEMNQPGF